MRLGRRLLVLATATLATVTFTAGVASAQEEAIETINEASLDHCDIDAGNCQHHIQGSQVLTVHQFGSEAVVGGCNEEFIARLGEDGNGYIDIYENDAATNPSCTRIQCNGVGEPAAETDWPITGAGEYTGSETDEGHFTYRFCLDTESNPNGAGSHCTIEVDIVNHGDHHYGLSAENEECPIVGMQIWVEIDGAWESEATPGDDDDDIEIIH